MNEKEKCIFCGGRGYITRIVTDPKPTIDEKCYYCEGTGKYDPDYKPEEPIMRLPL